MTPPPAKNANPKLPLKELDLTKKNTAMPKLGFGADSILSYEVGRRIGTGLALVKSCTAGAAAQPHR